MIMMMMMMMIMIMMIIIIINNNNVSNNNKTLETTRTTFQNRWTCRVRVFRTQSCVRLLLMFLLLLLLLIKIKIKYNNNNNNNNFTIFLSGLFIDKTTSFTLFRKEDHGPSIFTCPAHTIDVRQERISSAPKW